MEYYLALKRNTVLSHEKIQRNVKRILLSERSQSEVDILCMIDIYTWHPGKGKTMEILKRSLLQKVVAGGMNRAWISFRAVKILCDVTVMGTCHYTFLLTFRMYCCCCWVASVLSDSVRPHRRQPTRLPRSWDSPGKNTGVGCHFFLQCVKVKSLGRVWLVATPWTAAHRLLHPWDFPGKSTGVGAIAFSVERTTWYKPRTLDDYDVSL